MAEKTNVPEIRFAGFTDPWEQRKLGELCELNPTAVLPDSFEYVDLESVAGTDMISHRREEKLTAPSRAQRLASFGDIFYQTVRPYQKNNYFYELPDEDYVFSTGYAQLRPLCDGRFLFSSLQRDQFVSCVLEHCTGTSYPAINANDLAALFLAVPIDAEEQRLVGSILKPIDSLITLHQRKYDKLAQLKKSMLDKMFPKPGERFPEIRFAGFTDPWEQRKLNEYLETSREKNESCRFDKEDVLSVSGDYGIVNQIEFQGRSYAGASVANYGVVHKGDVVYTKSPLRSNPYGIIKTNRGNDGIVSTLYSVYHPAERAHPDFVEVYFEQNARMNNYMAPLVSKGAKNDMKVSAENALKGAVIFPEIEEQEVIASYFSQLDHLITLHQRKCQYHSLCGYLLGNSVSWERLLIG